MRIKKSLCASQKAGGQTVNTGGSLGSSIMVTAISHSPASDAHSIAEYLICFGRDHGDPLTNLKLQKLLYYAQGLFLAKHHRILYREPLQAWVRGPVVYEVWRTYNHHKWQPILAPVREPILHADVSESIQTLIHDYWDYSAYQLERMTHAESPWLNAREGSASDTPSSAQISVSDIYEFFSALGYGREAKAQKPI
jgi:uncharacterized phage-associated protein